MLAARHLSIAIQRDWGEVYAFVSDPQNLPRWAAGLGVPVRQVGGAWFAGTGRGDVRLRFAARNELGVLDHAVTLASGVEVQVPMRVIANGAGCEVIFTLFRQPGMSKAQCAEDADAVERDLRTLKRVLER